MPGGHRHTVPYTEQWRPSQYMTQLDGLDDVAFPMQVGDALLIHQHLPHVSPPNRSDHIRWSEDIRYQDARLPIKSQREPGLLGTEPGASRRNRHYLGRVPADTRGRRSLPTGDQGSGRGVPQDHRHGTLLAPVAPARHSRERGNDCR